MTELLTRMERLADIRTAVYRFFDADGQLLYLGITHDLEERWKAHERNQPWWLDVSRREFTWCESRADAELIEVTATAAERPRYDRSGRRATGGEWDDRLALETDRAMLAITEDIDNGTFPTWHILPNYGELSRRYGIPPIGITRGLSKLAHHQKTIVYHQDQYAVSRPDCIPSRDAKRIGLLFFLASSAFGDSSFTITDLTEATGAARGTAYAHVKRWESDGRVERVGRVSGGRALIYRIAQHPDPDPPEVLTCWREEDVRQITTWLNEQLDADMHAALSDPATGALVEHDRAIVEACLPGKYAYGVSEAAVRVLKVVARRYASRSGCLTEWGIEAS